jgi:hypothetical protein
MSKHRRDKKIPPRGGGIFRFNTKLNTIFGLLGPLTNYNTLNKKNRLGQNKNYL